MTDKVKCLSDFGSACLYLNVGHGTMPINLRPKFPPYVVIFVLYKFCVVLNCPPFVFLSFVCVLYYVLYCIFFTFSFPFFSN